MIITCVICSNNFEKTTNSKYCSPACSKEASRQAYIKRQAEKPCGHCGQLYVGSRNSSLCITCKTVKRPKNFKTVEAKLICTKCGDVMGTFTKSLTRAGTTKPHKVCDKCKQETSILRSKRLTECNPMHDPEVAERVSQTNKTRFETDPDYRQKMQEIGRKAGTTYKLVNTEEQRARARERMINDNPMKRPEVKAVVQSKLKGGSLPKGPAHGNWKGNRVRAQTIRTRLYPVWTFPHLEKAQFKCEECGAKDTKLEVHHESQSFKECLAECLNGVDINLLTEAELEAITQLVIKKHEQITGRVVCVPCHRIIDPARR